MKLRGSDHVSRSASMAVLHARRGKAIRRLADATPQSGVLLRRLRTAAALRADALAACQPPLLFDKASARFVNRAARLLPPNEAKRRGGGGE